MNTTRLLTATGLLSLSLAACADQDADTGSTDEPIVNGTAYTGTDRLVDVAQRCTGTMVTNDWVLTAAHCAVTPGEGVNLGASNGPQYWIDKVVGHPSLDFALLHLTSPMVINGSTTGFKSFMYTGATSTIAGKHMQLQGFGYNQANCANESGSGFGTMRWANFHTSSSPPDQYNVEWTSDTGNQASGFGDSGAPYWYFYNGIPYQIGVEKTGNCVNNAIGAVPSTFEPWVFAVIYGTPRPIPTTTACHNYVCSGNGKGEWNVWQKTMFQLWDRPLAEGTYNSTTEFNPCPDTTGAYIFRANWSLNGTDAIRIVTGNESPTMTGTGAQAWWGSGNMRIEYSTAPGSGSSPGMNWLDVQCKPSAAEDLVCHGTRCGTTHDSIPPNWGKSVAWTPCGGKPFYYFLNAKMNAPDYVQVNGRNWTGGEISALWQYVSSGTTTVRVQAGSTPVYSPGIRSLYAVCSGW